MKTRLLTAFIVTSALTACGGGGGGGASDDFSFTLSNGLLSAVEVPDGDSLAALPAEARRAVNGFVAYNEANDPSTSLPQGNATYDGIFSLGFDNADDTIVAGSVYLTFDFQAETLDGFFNNMTVYDAGGFQIAQNAGLFDVAGTTASNTFSATANGDVEIAGDTYAVDGLLDGAFGGADAAYGAGAISGEVTNPDQSTDSITGVFTLEPIPPG